MRLAKDLKSVETLQDLRALESKIKKRLDKITDLMIVAQGYNAVNAEPSKASDQLLHAMERIYALEGGQEAFEQIAASSLQKLQLMLH